MRVEGCGMLNIFRAGQIACPLTQHLLPKFDKAGKVILPKWPLVLLFLHAVRSVILEMINTVNLDI